MPVLTNQELEVIKAQAYDAGAKAASEDIARLDYLDRACSEAPDGRIVLRATPGKLRWYIDNARKPTPLTE